MIDIFHYISMGLEHTKNKTVLGEFQSHPVINSSSRNEDSKLT